MKKSVICAALVAAMCSPLAFAQSTSGDAYRPSLSTGDGAWFVSGNVGRTDGGTAGRFGTGNFDFLESNEGRDTGYGVTGGYRWKVSDRWGVGAELGYVDLGNYKVRNVFNDEDVDQTEGRNALRGWTAGANARVNITPAWYVGMRGGYFRASDNSTDYYNTIGQELRVRSGRDPERSSWYAGVGTGWNATENFSIGLHYDYFRAKSGTLVDEDSGAEIDGPKRSTALVGLTAEYAF